MNRSPTLAHSGLVEQRVLAVRMAFFKALSTILLSSGAPAAQKKSQLSPVVKQVRMALPSPEFGSTLRSRQLCFHPVMQGFHQRAAVFLMETQALLRR